MIRWPGDLTNDNGGWLRFQMLMNFRGSLSSDDFEDTAVDRGVVLLSSEISYVLWPA